MEHYCVFCGKRLTGQKKKYCNNICKCRHFYKTHPEKCNLWRKKNPKPKVNNKCLTCGTPCGRKRYCSDICKPIRIHTQNYWKEIERLNVKCKICQGTILIPHVHHINGNHKDNRRENLVVLCPLCHSKIHRPKIKLSKITKKEEEIESLLKVYREKLEKS